MKDTVKYEGQFLRMRTVDGWDYVERTNASDVVVIIAEDNGCLILVEQFRPPFGKQVFELPAGLVGDIKGAEDEDILTAARRELLEETGYLANKLSVLHRGPVSSGLTNETMTFVLAKQLEKVEQGGGDESEDITVHLIPVRGLQKWINDTRAQGSEVDPKLFSALFFLNYSPESISE